MLEGNWRMMKEKKHCKNCPKIREGRNYETRKLKKGKNVYEKAHHRYMLRWKEGNKTRKGENTSEYRKEMVVSRKIKLPQKIRKEKEKRSHYFQTEDTQKQIYLIL